MSTAVSLVQATTPLTCTLLPGTQDWDLAFSQHSKQSDHFRKSSFRCSRLTAPQWPPTSPAHRARTACGLGTHCCLPRSCPSLLLATWLSSLPSSSSSCCCSISQAHSCAGPPRRLILGLKPLSPDQPLPLLQDSCSVPSRRSLPDRPAAHPALQTLPTLLCWLPLNS